MIEHICPQFHSLSLFDAGLVLNDSAVCWHIVVYNSAGHHSQSSVKNVLGLVFINMFVNPKRSDSCGWPVVVLFQASHECPDPSIIPTSETATAAAGESKQCHFQAIVWNTTRVWGCSEIGKIPRYDVNFLDSCTSLSKASGLLGLNTASISW